MEKKALTLAARVAALEKAVAGFFAGASGRKKTRKKPVKKTKKAKSSKPKKTSRKTSRVMPPPAQMLLPTGDPVFVTPLDQL